MVFSINYIDNPQIQGLLMVYRHFLTSNCNFSVYVYIYICIYIDPYLYHSIPTTHDVISLSLHLSSPGWSVFAAPGVGPHSSISRRITGRIRGSGSKIIKLNGENRQPCWIFGGLSSHSCWPDGHQIALKPKTWWSKLKQLKDSMFRWFQDGRYGHWKSASNPWHPRKTWKRHVEVLQGIDAMTPWIRA